MTRLAGRWAVMFLLAGRWAVMFLLASWGCGVCGGELAATLDVTADPVQPAGLPILLTLSVRNTGTEPISYWCGAAGGYLNAGGFIANISYANGTRVILSERLSNSNGEFAWDAGRMHELRPGESFSFPAALRSLPAAKYSIRFSGDAQGRVENGHFADLWFPQTSSAPLKVEVRKDEKLAAARDADLIAKLRKGDAFAQHVAAHFPRPEIRKALEQDLAGDDLIAAGSAIDTLWPDYNPPADAAPLIARAIRSHAKPINDGHDEWLMHVLLQMSQPFSTKEVKAAVEQVAAARPAGRVHNYAQARLTDAALAALKESATTTTQDEDPVEDLLIHTLVKSADPKIRARAYEALATYPHSPRAVQTALDGLADPDRSVREAAEKTLDAIHRMRQRERTP